MSDSPESSVFPENAADVIANQYNKIIDLQKQLDLANHVVLRQHDVVANQYSRIVDLQRQADIANRVVARQDEAIRMFAQIAGALEILVNRR